MKNCEGPLDAEIKYSLSVAAPLIKKFVDVIASCEISKPPKVPALAVTVPAKVTLPVLSR